MTFREPTEEEIAALVTSNASDLPVSDSGVISEIVNDLPEGTLEPFHCSICSLLKLHRYNMSARYCTDCWRDYQARKAQLFRKSGDKMSIDQYRSWREMNDLPVALKSSIKKGRPKREDKTDLDSLEYKDFWKYVAAKAVERFGPMRVYIDHPDYGQQETAWRGQWNVAFKPVDRGGA